MKDRYFFPAIFKVANDKFSVTFPDLPGCVTSGHTTEQAVSRAKEAMSLHLYGMEEEGYEIPEPTEISKLKVEHNQYVVLIEAWMPPFRDEMKNKAVKKTLTIPKWLDDLATENGVNFSHVLQDALKAYLGVENPK